MNSREVTHAYRIAQWAGLAKERGELGMSIRAFCAMKGFAENTYFYWQRRLRNAAGEKIMNLEPGAESLMPKGWAAVVESRPEPSKGVTIEVGGCKISVDSGTDTELLLKVCRTLKELC
jgi:putative transposase